MHDERKRAARACNQCRRLKEKCEGGVPCSRCRHLRRTCEFKSTASQAHDAALLTRSLGPANSKPGFGEMQERLLYMERILRNRFGDIPLDTHSLSQMAKSLSLPRSEFQARSSPSLEETEDAAIEEEVCTIDPVEDTTTHYSGEFSYWNFSMRIKRYIDDKLSSSSFAVCFALIALLIVTTLQLMHLPVQTAPIADELPNYWRPDQSQTNSRSMLDLKTLPPRQISEFLIKIFFKYATTYFFCVDRTWLLDKLDVLYECPHELGSKGVVISSIILACLAIGTQYAYLNSPHRKGNSKSTITFSEDEVGAVFYQQAVRSLPDVIESSCLESVQACLLFGFYSLSVDASGLGYIYLNIALKLAMQNGMHRKYAGNAFAPVMLETRNRVWWTVYNLERKISIFHGRPLSTHRSDIDAEIPRDHDDLCRHDAPTEVLFLVASTYLAHSLEDCYTVISRLRDLQKHHLHTIVSDLFALRNGLAVWWATLPEDIRSDQVQPTRPNRRAILHLRLEYCLVRLFIGRPFIFSRASTTSNYTSPETQDRGIFTSDSSPSTSKSQTQKHSSNRAELVADCILAAEEALGLLRTLRDTDGGLAHASYVEYSSCRATLLVLIAYSIQHQSDHCRSLLQLGLEMIRDMSAAGNSARSEVLLIEALKHALTRLHSLNSTIADGVFQDTNSDPMLSEYDNFKHWESLWKSSGASLASFSSQQAPSSLTVRTGPQQGSTTSGNFSSAPHRMLERPGQGRSAGSISTTAWSTIPDRSEQDFTTPRRSEHDFSTDAAVQGLPDLSVWPEFQMLDNFMALPQYMFGSGNTVDATFGSMNE